MDRDIDIYGNFGLGNRKEIPKKYQEFLPQNIAKPQASYPYTYDPFLIFFNEEAKKEATDSIYTDRLLQWDWEKHNKLCRKHFGNEGQYWSQRDPKKIEAFLCDWTGKRIVLVANIQCVNVSNGYPLWRLDFYSVK